MGGYLTLFFGMGGVALVASLLGLFIYLAVNCWHAGGDGVWFVFSDFPVGYCQAFVLLSVLLLISVLTLLRRYKKKKKQGS